MRHNGFEIKISDMLNSKVTDTINFENRKIKDLKQLTEDGVSGTITIQSIDQESLLVTLDLECTLNECCDRCGTEYQRKIIIEGYTAKYITQQDPNIKDSEDDILFIDIKNGVIDVEEMIYHAIQLEEPFVKYCKNCESIIPDNSIEEDY